MAVRQFDGVDDDIRHATGALAGMQYGTFAALIKAQAPLDDYGSILSLVTSGNVLRAQWYYDESVEWHNIFVPNRTTEVIQLNYANQWALLVARKASGSVSVTFSLYRFNQGQWTHASSGNFANWTSPGANGHVRRSDETGDQFFRGLIAVQAVWANRVPFANNTAVQNAGLHQSLDAWFDAEPDALWAFNQESVTDPADDLTGNGADQIARTGTAVVTNDDPPGFDFDLGGEEPGEIDLGHHDASPTFHAPTIQGTVDLAHLDASASFAAPTVAAASVDLEAFDASPTFHDPTVAAASVDLAHLDASATFHDPTLFDNSVQLGHLDASATFHDLTVSGSVTLDAFDAAPVFHDTEVAGSVTLDALDASASFHDPTVGAASVDLDPFDASATFHTLSVSGEGIGLAHLAATATFHTLTVGATTVDLEHLAATAIFHSPLVIPVIVHSPGVGKTAGVTAGARTRASESAGAAVGDGQFGITKRTSNAGVAADPAGEGGS